MGFVADPLIGLPICAAVILGGIGFPVIMQLKKPGADRAVEHEHQARAVGHDPAAAGRVGVHHRARVEQPGHAGPARRRQLLAGFFQSVQTRTAGFNSVDLGRCDSATLLGMDALMFIGGGAAGTAGGIKITTFGVLFFIVLAEIRGEPVVNIFGKRLSRAVHREAIAVALLSVAASGRRRPC